MFVYCSCKVQTGFGRTGSHFWGFQTHDVVPDIVTMAKGIGNGFPMAAVVTTRGTNISYFKTWGSLNIKYTVYSSNGYGNNNLSKCVLKMRYVYIQSQNRLWT